MEPDIFDMIYEEDPTCLQYWELVDGVWYTPFHFEFIPEVALNIPEVMLNNQEVLHTMSINSETKDVQTDDWTQENSVNTNDNWEHSMRVLVEQNNELTEECESLQKQQADEESEYKSQIENLKKLRDDKKRQHQVLLDKIESVRLKLELNSSKTSRKNFSAKVEELTAEKDQKLEAVKRLTQELEELDGRLNLLTEEQKHDKLSWEQEIAALLQEAQSLSKQVEESNQAALKDERAALESERELAVSQVEDWIAEAERYLSTLRSDTSPKSKLQQNEWEKNVAMVRSRLGKLQSSYNENLKQLLQGKELDSLPKILPPLLPHIPMIDLLNFTTYTAIHPPVTQPQFHPARRHTPPPLSAHNPAAFAPHTLEQNMPPIRPPTRTNTHPTYTLPYTAVPAAPVVSLAPGASARLPASQALPSNPQPAGKLDKLLEKLGTQFPQCTRAQIMGVLQQVKSERGTMAGMSVEDIKQQVEQKLSERLAPGPIAPPAGSRHSHRPQVHVPSAHSFQAAPSVRKLCLMCQNHVEPGTQYITHCPHTLHRECISVWLQSSKNNSCPFCPSK
ncbi:RING finger protein 214 isoform X2 [Tachysurus fulvidraco]|uniref:RING finger protein 214 isoform X2 n=1 Tax=Tachysurus fulvidraco TaxID=1234273 RepID=UPI001FEF003B|nr:RING finger protein 214 isoform X2 [Tachysurus fulvidraco]